MTTFRDIQLKGLEILKEVVHICEKHNLAYHLNYGTLLGAIRHNGFIPWDNDIDITMPIEDYRKFIRIARVELPSSLFLQTYFSDPGYNEMWAKVRANNTTSLPVSWKKLNIHWGIGIDIFPLIGTYQNPLLRKLQIKLHGLCRTLIAKDFVLVTNPIELSDFKLRMLYFLPRWLRIAMCRLIEVFVFKGTHKSSHISIVDCNINQLFDSSSFSPTRPHIFEDQDFKIPNDYHYILTKLYGDYMVPPPESERNGHEGTLGKIIYDCNENYTSYLE